MSCSFSRELEQYAFYSVLLCECVIELCSVRLIDGVSSQNAFAFSLDLTGLVYNSPSPTSRVMTTLMTSSIEVGGERRSHTKFGDDVTATS